MNPMAQVAALMGKELRLEWKQKYALSGLLLYSVTMVFVVGFAFREGLNGQAWNIVFWIILLFIAVNAVGRSFMSESHAQNLYVYGLAGPAAIIAAKLLYNTVLMMGLTLVTLFFYQAFAARQDILNGETGVPYQADMLQFAVCALLGAAGFAANLTLVSAIAARARNSATLTAVLGFPLMIPELLISTFAGNNALQGQSWADSGGEMLFSLCYFGLMAAISFILFPFIWRD